MNKGETSAGYVMVSDAEFSDERVSKMARILSDRLARDCYVSPDDHWKFYSQELIDDVWAMVENVDSGDISLSPETEMILASDYDQLKAENERLKEEVRSWVIRIQQRGIEMDELSEERDTLCKQLDEARELLTVASEIIHEQCLHIDSPMTDLGSEALTRLDDWLEANK